MRIPSGSTTNYIYFVAVDATDLSTRETGLTSFTVYRSRDGAAAAAMTTPTVNEVDATNMPGLYELLLDEDTTIDASNVSEEMALHITATGMAPVTRTVELYRPLSRAATDNLEDMYDGTGYTDESAPASRGQVGAIGAASGGSVNIEAAEDNTGGAIDPSAAAFVGSVQGATTFANTESENGVYHDIDDTANDIDVVYGFDVGTGRTATSVLFHGFVQGSNDEMRIKVYDHAGAGWDTIGTISGTNSSTNTTVDVPLLLKHTGAGAEAGKVYIRLETDSTTPSNLSVDQLLVTAVASEGGVANGSTVTLAATAANESFIGKNWNLDLGGQAVSNIYVEGASVSGTGTGSNTMFVDCTIEAGASIPAGTYLRCKFEGTSGSPVTESGTGQYLFLDCASAVAGAASPYFNFSGAGGAVGINNRRWSGGANWTLDSNCDLSHEVLAGGGTTITTGGADVEVRGICRDLTVVMSAAETVQFAGVTGAISLSGTTTGNANLYGVSDGVSDTTSAATVSDGTLSQAGVNLEVLDVLRTDTLDQSALCPQEAPPVNATFAEALAYLYKAWRNKSDQSATTFQLYADDGSTVDQKATVSESAGTVTKGEVATGP